MGRFVEVVYFDAQKCVAQWVAINVMNDNRLVSQFNRVRETSNGLMYDGQLIKFILFFDLDKIFFLYNYH